MKEKDLIVLFGTIQLTVQYYTKVYVQHYMFVTHFHTKKMLKVKFLNLLLILKT